MKLEDRCGVNWRMMDFVALKSSTPKGQHMSLPIDPNEEKKGKKKYLLKRSNQLIQAKSSSTLFAKKLIAICMYQIQSSKDGDLVSYVTAKELKKILGIQGGSGSVYAQLRKVSKDLVQHYIYIENEESHHLRAFPIISDLEYNNGVLRLQFSQSLKPYLYTVSSKYTLTPLLSLTQLSHTASYQIYDNLMVYAWRIPKEPGGYFDVVIPFAELRFIVGQVDTNNPKIQGYIDSGYSYEEILEKIKEYPYKNWRDFKRNILEVAKKEFDDKNVDIAFEYFPIKTGAQHKITAIKFRIYWRDTASVIVPREEQDDSEEYILKMSKQITRIMDASEGKLTNSDATRLLQYANDNVERVLDVLEVGLSQGDRIGNLMGWMVAAITGKWIVHTRKKTSEKTAFSNFEERDHNDDFYKDAIRKIITEPVEEKEVIDAEAKEIENDIDQIPGQETFDFGFAEKKQDVTPEQEKEQEMNEAIASILSDKNISKEAKVKFLKSLFSDD